MKSKNILRALILLLVFSLLFTGCDQRPNLPEGAPVTASHMEKITIVTSFYPIYIMTLNVSKDIPGVEVFNLTKPITGCLHDYQLTPDDLTRLQKADIFVVNGAGMESFLDKVIRQQPNLKTIEASAGITLLKGDGAAENPHVWVSISGAVQQVQNIGRELALLDPAHADRYEANTAAYIEKLDSLKTKMHQELANVKNPNIVTFHEAFPYFAEEFDLNIIAVIEREPGADPSAAELAETIEIVRAANVTALFAEPQYPVKAAEVIARETGAKVYILDPAVTGPDDPDAYLNIMAENLTVLQGALN